MSTFGNDWAKEAGRFRVRIRRVNAAPGLWKIGHKPEETPSIQGKCRRT
jgi:hypothetical protein